MKVEIIHFNPTITSRGKDIFVLSFPFLTDKNLLFDEKVIRISIKPSSLIKHHSRSLCLLRTKNKRNRDDK